jgi:hypothetical protein
MLRENLLRHGRFYGAENSQNRPVDLIYSCSIGSRHASSMRFAKVLSDTNEAQRINNGVCKKEFQTEKTSNLTPKT